MKKVFLYILLFIPAIIVSIFSEKTPIDILAEFVQMDFKELAVLLKDVKVLQTVLLLSVAVNAVLLFILHKSIQARYVEPTETTVASEASVPTTSDPTDKPIPTTSTSTEATEATEATEPTASTEKEAIRVGTLISFGHYQQDSGALSDPESISWLVLEVDGNKALVISEYGLESVPYNRTKKAVTWETCTLREWLNETFYNDAFTAEERNHIVATTVTPHENPNCTCDQGNETTDYIFLLSATEYEAYIKENGNIHTKYQYGRPTAFTRTQNVDATGQNDYCWYWLRTSATDNVYACSVNSYGTIDYSSREVYKTGGMVRPAMWITVE